MRFKKGKGNIKKLKGDVLIYSLYKETCNLPEFNSLLVNNIPRKLKDGTAFGIYLTNSIDKMEDKSLNSPKGYAFSHLLENSVDEEFKKKILASYHGRELIMTLNQFGSDSEQELLECFEGVNEIVLPGSFSTLPLCMIYNNINLKDYIIRFIYQKNSNLMVNVENKSYGETTPEESRQIVKGYFNNMNKALVSGDKGEFIDTKRKLLDFAAESELGKNYISRSCDLLLEGDNQQRVMIGSYVGLMIQKIQHEEYLDVANYKKELTKIENILNKNQITKILKSGRDKINHQQ